MLPILYLLVYCIYQSQSPNSSHPLFPLLATISLFSASAILFLLCKQVHLYHFFRFHRSAILYNICFSHSDLLHSEWQFLGLFIFLQVAYFVPFYGWVFHCIYVLHLLYPFLCWWTFTLFSIVAVPIPTDSVGGFLFLHTLYGIYCL